MSTFRFGTPFIGTTPNYTVFEDDGTMVMYGDAVVWDDLRIPGLAVKLGASAPDLESFLGNLWLYSFDGGTTQEQVFFTCQLPHSYEEGTDISPHVHWAPSTGATGTVIWHLEYSWGNIYGAMSSPASVSVSQAASGTTWTHQMAVLPVLSGTGKTISSMLVCRLYRNPGQTVTLRF